MVMITLRYLRVVPCRACSIEQNAMLNLKSLETYSRWYKKSDNFNSTMNLLLTNRDVTWQASHCFAGCSTAVIQIYLSKHLTMHLHVIFSQVLPRPFSQKFSSYNPLKDFVRILASLKNKIHATKNHSNPLPLFNRILLAFHFIILLNTDSKFSHSIDIARSGRIRYYGR